MRSETADLLFDLSNLAAVIGGILVVIGTAGIFWTGSVRETFANDRLQSNEVKAATANKAAAEANEANTRLKIELERERTSRVQLERRMAPRRISAEQREAIIAKLGVLEPLGISVTGRLDAETQDFVSDLIDTLRGAGMRPEKLAAAQLVDARRGIRIYAANDYYAAGYEVASALQAVGFFIHGVGSTVPLPWWKPDTKIELDIGEKDTDPLGVGGQAPA